MSRGPLVVVGDLLLDEDIEGEATRLAPDAPAPVVDVAGVRRRAGGAGLAAVLAARLSGGRGERRAGRRGVDRQDGRRGVDRRDGRAEGLAEVQVEVEVEDESLPGVALMPGVAIGPGDETVPGVEIGPADAALPGAETLPGDEVLPGAETLPGDEVLPGTESLPGDAVMPGAETLPGDAVMPGDEVLSGVGIGSDVEVVLVTAIGSDEASEAARRCLGDRIRVVAVPLDGTLPVKTRVLAGGRPLLRLDRGGGTPGKPGPEALRALETAGAILVADYGRGTADVLREALAEAARRVPLVWDPHPRGGPPVPGARMATPNAKEAATFSDRPGTSLRAHADRGADLAERWGATHVAVTLGAAGALLTRAGSTAPLLVPAPPVTGGDPCGAGDCFAAAAAVALAGGALPEEAVERAVAEAAAFVGAGGASAVTGEAPPTPTPPTATPTTPPSPTPPSPGPEPAGDAFALARRVRARGGTVVATGGCFDLLHAGHVGLLERAARIGDCLIVCVNSDASLARLKGPGRPLTPLADRMRVLAALGSVDAVVAFDEDTPERLLEALRPDVWVKGGDYSPDGLPETRALRRWGGQTVVLPYLDGRSTTRIAHRAARAAAAGRRAR
ncbi:D-glycero-beta-D-manno-heptose 1-phosphate adenylyltransferase [Streptomyces sp. NPDC126499]|uniref:D-glycero-beta-D-manno-heptose 1-phosphate adenylyltransferase n=1 Tax=Streptomyces sp. NPDC126499 TaxID=3155314 RepID=UPI003333ADF1